jgi:hypothetical protein
LTRGPDLRSLFDVSVISQILWVAGLPAWLIGWNLYVTPAILDFADVALISLPWTVRAGISLGVISALTQPQADPDAERFRRRALRRVGIFLGSAVAWVVAVAALGWLERALQA